MAAKKRRRKKPGLVWRVLFGHNGPTKAELRKLWRQSFSNTFTLNVRDPQTGRVQKKRMRIDADGKIQEAKAPAKKKRPATKTPAKPSGRRNASQASKPSRASKSGATPRQRQVAAVPAPRRVRAEPLAERVLRNPDGTLAGSRKQKAPTYAQAQREYAKAMKNAAEASRRAEQLLGWEQTPRR